MRPVSVQFRHFWPGFDWRRHFGFLRERFALEESDDPEFVIFCVFEGGENRRRMPRVETKAVRIFYTPENVAPDMRHCEWSFGFAHEERVRSDRYRRLPNYPLRLWASGFESEALVKGDVDVEALLAEKTGFCNFVYSNPRCRARNAFFEKLSRYKRVDAPGRVCNNAPPIPRPGSYADVRPKLDYVRRYKFTIAFENESTRGYTTEKIVEPMLVQSLPIHWGDPEVGRDFDAASFVGYHDGCRHLDDLVERVVEIDRDDRLWAERIARPWLHGDRLPPHLERKRVADWFGRIFEGGGGA